MRPDRPAAPRAAASSWQLRAGDRPSRAGRARLAIALGGLCVVFAALAAADLANVRPVSGDDALIVTVSAHLAGTGTLGSPLHDGVFGADEHYFLNLPLQHVLHAVTFRVIGEGVAQARVVSVIATLVLLCASTVLALRWLGLRSAILTALLLVTWRSGLLGLDYGLPLLAVARTARYDATAVALLWLALLAFDVHLRRPHPVMAFAAGVLAALASLAQFHGALVLPALAALWLARRDGGGARPAGLAWLGLGLLLGVAPYAVWFAVHSADALAQLRLVHGTRTPEGLLGLLRSVGTEPLRFSAAATQRGIGQVGLLVGLVAAPLLLRAPTPARRDDEGAPRGLRAPLQVGGAMLLGLALFEATKAPLYALPLLPVFCMLLAAALDALWRFGRRRAGLRSGLAVGAATALALALAAEGVVALVRDRAAAAHVTPYPALAAEIDAALQPGARLLGPAQWSWGLRTRPYDEFRALALRQQALTPPGRPHPPLATMIRERQVRYVLLNEDVGSELLRGFHGAAFSLELSRLLRACTSPVRTWNDPTYGVVELRALAPACPAD